MKSIDQVSTKPVVILLVDDDPDYRMLVREAIGACGVSSQVWEVGSVEQAMEFLHRRGRYQTVPRPGLIYLDLEMPGLNGQEALKRIRASEELSDIPIVMMTGVNDEREMHKAAVNGANSYTIKPDTAEQLLRTVLASTQYWLTIHRRPQQPRQGEMTA